ncbi:hypothetical protein ACO0QE_003449 [Hanseniaspora vineae]
MFKPCSFQLFFLIAGIYTTFLTWGLVQEPLTTKTFPNSNEQFRFPFVISSAQSLVASLFGLVYLKWTGNKNTLSFQQLLKECYPYVVLLSLTQSLSSPLATYSLKYVPYLTFQLSKTCKLIPVILVHLVIYKTKIPKKKQFVALIVTLGVTIFTLSNMKKTAKTNQNKSSLNSESSDLFSSASGYILLGCSLICDGLTNATQDSMLKRQPKITGAHLMVLCNAAILFWNTVYLVAIDQQQLTNSWNVLQMDFSAISTLLATYAVCGALGQIFIFQTLSKFGSIVLIMVTVTRKMVSMVLSIVVYGHQLTCLQYIGILIVFTGITYEALAKRSASRKNSEEMSQKKEN